MTAPPAIRPMLAFAAALRAHGFAVAPDQTIGFVEAVGILGPRDIGDIRRAARALFAIPPERGVEFEALFRAIFYGQTIAAEAETSDEDRADAVEPTGGMEEIDIDAVDEETGAEASVTERLGHRPPSAAAVTLDDFARQAPHRLPRRLSYRYAPARKGRRMDVRRTLREAVRRDGEVVILRQMRRKMRQRRILLLIDVSGSMADRSPAMLSFAHRLVQAADRVEVFTLGTRLTRITAALELADEDHAMARISGLVADFDGGTRLGEALTAFLDVPRFAAHARGAATVVLSDGMERGRPDVLIESVRHLARIAWRLDWLTPLAADPEFRPETEALAAILPMLDTLAPGDSAEAVATHVLNMARAA